MPFQKGHKIWVGRSFSDEHRLRLSEAKKGKKLTEKHKQILRESALMRGVRPPSRKGAILSKEHKAKIKESAKGGDKNNKWRGEAVGYGALHSWVTRNLGKPQRCEACGTDEERKYHWANISGEYKRDLTDWRRMCVPCHKRFDLKKVTA